MCPVLGIIPLYHSIEAWKKNRKSDVSYVISLKKAYSWTKRIFIALLIIWIVAAILFSEDIILDFQRFDLTNCIINF